MIPYGRQSIDTKDVKAVAKVLPSDFITQGPKVREFESALEHYTGAKFCVAVSSGTAALHLAYLAVGLQEGDEIITTPNTFVATTNMMLAVGARPVFCDIRPDTGNMDERKIEALITKRTRAIVPVHFAGRPCDMKAIRSLAKRRRLLVIEDAAHALGADHERSKIGSSAYSDMTVFSFHPVKSITTGEGGAVMTNDIKFAERLRSLRSHGIHKDKNGFNVMTELGYNYRLTDIQAALGASQLERLDSFIAKRRSIAHLYDKLLGGIREIALPQVEGVPSSAWHIYVIRTRNEHNRLPLYHHLLKNGVGVNFHYPCVYRHPYYQSNGFRRVHCPEAEAYEKTAITLPLHPLLKKAQTTQVADAIKKFFSHS